MARNYTPNWITAKKPQEYTWYQLLQQVRDAERGREREWGEKKSATSVGGDAKKQCARNKFRHSYSNSDKPDLGGKDTTPAARKIFAKICKQPGLHVAYSKRGRYQRLIQRHERVLPGYVLFVKFCLMTSFKLTVSYIRRRRRNDPVGYLRKPKA